MRDNQKDHTVSDPFAIHQTSENLETSTAMTTVTEATMDHAARHAAELAEEAARAAASTAMTKKGPRKAATAAPPTIASPDVAVNGSAPGIARGEPGGGETVNASPLHLEADRAVALAEVEDEVSIAGFVVPALAFDEGTQPQTDDSVGAFSPGVGRTNDVLNEFSSKIVDLVHANVESSLTYWSSVMRAKSVSEAVALNANHLRSQMDAMLAQGRDLSVLAQRAFSTSLNPMKQPLDRP